MSEPDKIKELSVQIIKLLTEQELQADEAMSALAVATAGMIRGWWSPANHRGVMRAHAKNIKEILVLLESNMRSAGSVQKETMQ